YCLIRKIGDSTDPSILVFYWGFFALIAFIPFRLLSSQPLVIPQTFVEGLMMVGVGLTSLAAQYFFNKGVQLEKAAIASVVRNSSAIYSLIFQVTILEIPKGFLLSLFGGLLILVVIVGSSIQKFRSA
ncbi:MAG: EamA family transporter, partial [archaeon]|nr:EamA family transporter [archaeon]